MADGPTGLLEKSLLIVMVISAVALSAGAASSAHSSLISCSAEQNSSTMKIQIQIPGQNVTGAPKFWDQCQSVDRKETITKLVLDGEPYPIKDIMPG